MKNRPTNSLPTQAHLAVIAAATGRQKPSEAIEWAFAIWEEAGRVLADKHESARIRMPRKFPARFDQFLSLIVHGKTMADRHASLRAMFRDEIAAPLLIEGTLRDDDNETVLGATGKRIEMFKQYGFGDQGQWLDLARRYSHWWKRHLSEERRKAARTKPPAS